MLILPLLLSLISISNAQNTLPELLTHKSFHNTIKEAKLSLIEFYSPYCSHCNAFAPTWEDTFNQFQNDVDSSNIKMYQVNCIESGDLCQDEQILAYPSLKIYDSNGFIQNYPNSLKRNKENIIEFMKEQVIEHGGISDGPIVSKSELITTQDMINYLQNVNEHPILISFWPSFELTDLNDLNWKIFEKSDYYEDCLEFQRIWSIISNSLSSTNIKIGHFNCFKNEKICKELGIKPDFKPKVKLFLPNLENNKIISYENENNAKDIISFTKHTLSISKFTKTDSIQLMDTIKTNLKPLKSLPSKAENTFIYLYDEMTTTKEDFQILPYLIDEFAKHESTNFLISNDSNILKIMEFQQRNLINTLNNNNKPFQFNEDKYIINSMSTLPTIINFKEYSLLPSIYQSFGPYDIRDEFLIKQFIKKNSSPFITELTNKNFKDLLTNDEQLVIITTNGELPALDQFILNIHEYEEIKSTYTYNELIKARDLKKLKSDEYKSQNDYKQMVKSLRKEIKQPTPITSRYLYLDISKPLPELGIQVNNEVYQNGDVIIINSNGWYYNKDIDGGSLNSTNFVKTLETLNLDTSKEKYLLSKTLLNSPFNSKFRLFDNIHQFGIIGYIGLIISIIVIGKLVRKRFNRSNNGSYLPLFEEKKD